MIERRWVFQGLILFFLSLLPMWLSCGLVDKGTHNPGRDCTWPGCHGYAAPAWTYSGTVFTAADRLGPARGVSVHITDLSGELRLAVNSAGNFYTLAGDPASGYRVFISRGKDTRTMKSEQTSGACNSCHSPDGVVAPLNLN
jgi:hypothetical protein